MLWGVIMRVPAFLAILAATTVAAAAEPSVERIDVLDAGIFALEIGATTAEPGAPGGETTAVTKATLIEATTTVPAAIGTNFGFRYTVVGEPEGEMATLDFVASYPEPGLADPDADAPIRELRFSREKAVGATDYYGYTPEVEWELVPGAWTFEIWFEGKQLASQTFTMTE
jgi:hypothetical protein